MGLSIEKMIEIMKMELHAEDKNFPKLLSTQQAIAASVFSTAARIDENQLRKQAQDKLSEILDLIRSEQAAMPARRAATLLAAPLEGSSS